MAKLPVNDLRRFCDTCIVDPCVRALHVVHVFFKFELVWSVHVEYWPVAGSLVEDVMQTWQVSKGNYRC